MSAVKIRIAAAATVVGLAGLAGLALGSGQQQPQKAATVAQDPIVKTKVIRRTIHVTKHAKPKKPAASGGGGGTATASASGASGGAEPVSTGSSSAGGASEPVTTGSSSAGTSEPVTTGSSSTGGGGYAEEADHEVEHESEGGFDD